MPWPQIYEAVSKFSTPKHKHRNTHNHRNTYTEFYISWRTVEPIINKVQSAISISNYQPCLGFVFSRSWQYLKTGMYVFVCFEFHLLVWLMLWVLTCQNLVSTHQNSRLFLVLKDYFITMHSWNPIFFFLLFLSSSFFSFFFKQNHFCHFVLTFHCQNENYIHFHII